MTWPIFAVVQLGITAVGLAIVLVLRQWQLKRRLAAAGAAAADEVNSLLEAVEQRFEAVASEATAKWLAERTDALGEEDPVEQIQKLVLQHEREAIPDFVESMRKRLEAVGGGSAVEEQWRTLRSRNYETATGLIERYPASHRAIVTLFEAFAELDEALGVELPPLPEPAEPADGEADSAEHLQAANDLLRAQLEDAQKALEEAREAGAKAGEKTEKEEDLKALLVQFTRDSRDMMACIQELEQDNQRLREQLEQASAPKAPADNAA